MAIRTELKYSYCVYYVRFNVGGFGGKTLFRLYIIGRMMCQILDARSGRCQACKESGKSSNASFTEGWVCLC